MLVVRIVEDEVSTEKDRLAIANKDCRKDEDKEITGESVTCHRWKTKEWKPQQQSKDKGEKDPQGNLALRARLLPMKGQDFTKDKGIDGKREWEHHQAV